MERENSHLEGKKVKTDDGYSEKKIDLAIDLGKSGSRKVTKKKKNKGIVFSKPQELVIL